MRRLTTEVRPLNQDTPTVYAVEKARGRSRRLRRLRFAILVLIVLVAAAAGGSYAWFSCVVGTANGRVDDATKAALASSPTNPLVSVPESPSAMDILVLGSDIRADESGGRSDSLMLVHVDPANNRLSLLSIPRDLRVEIPGHGLNKINTAYSLGGAALSIQTVKELTGVNIDHFVQVDFAAFQALTDTLGGVYVDVDRRYLNTDLSYEPIDIQPGYQLLNGHDALEYVRFRHDKNADFGRMLRQQRFLSALKEQVGSLGAGLALKLPRLTRALFSNTTTDLSANDFLKLAYWAIRLNGDRVRELRIVGTSPTIDGVSYVVASQEVISQAVTELLTTDTPPKAASTSQAPIASLGTTGVSDVALWKALAGAAPFALEAPGYLPAGYAYSDLLPQADRQYSIKTGGGKKPAVHVIYRYLDRDQYLGVSETSWLDAPVAARGTEVLQNGVTYTVVGTVGRADHVWWKKDGVLLWVSNTLSYLVPESELLKMAESFGAVSKE
jgi:polyisoprenyl-teichoic acid--peptidoglycan teichoic acid transferase